MKYLAHKLFVPTAKAKHENTQNNKIVCEQKMIYAEAITRNYIVNCTKGEIGCNLSDYYNFLIRHREQ